ncbi:fungal hydrophobin [Dichomitus squalens LYAD-421 SS1]|uniref:Hydrophobin n=1 Tax=Dichomitus squalens TaxID=114155 RepID=A0A4Q9MLL1_9APHY|nr:fungal hydrophobin [Dichomitus squalens LYAD-421 SS1]EJF63705.1 fungal hydrophobin [Dichomitus squalens LYAD-421 SS1]TBU28459.1 fungal hydrophobin-domain-containing protein [Dichomitus squalens]
MFARAFAYAALALPLLAVATPVEVRNDASSCSTGSIQCCSSVQSSDSASSNIILGLLGIVLGDITGLIGLGCSPITVVGVGSGNACSANAVCCTNNNVGGLISIGCLPIEL